MGVATPGEVLKFWLDEVGKDKWYVSNAEVDDAIRTRFMATWEAAHEGALSRWCDCAKGTLAYLLVTDQFSRNMFRGEGTAFSTDVRAVRAAKSGLAQRFDLMTAEPERQFFYMPLVHSESASDQERAVRLILTRLTDSDAKHLLHARAHREVIRQFGRFPHRNEALGRASTGREDAYLTNGGYGGVVRAMQAA